MNQLLKNLLIKIQSTRGNSLMEFAVVTAMMAILAATAAPKLSELSEGAKFNKTMSELDKIAGQAANFYQETAVEEGRGRFPGQDKYNLPVGGHADNQAIEDDLLHVYNAAGEITDPADFTGYTAEDGYDWVSIFGVSNFDFKPPPGATLRWDDEDEIPSCNVCPGDSTIGRKEWAKLFPGGPVGSPFQDGHLVYQVVAGSGSGARAESPILYLADIENPSQLHVIFQP